MLERECEFGNWPQTYRLPMYAPVLVDMVDSDLIDWGGGIIPRAGVTHGNVPPASYAAGEWTPNTRVEVVTAGHSGAGPGLQVIVRCTDEEVWPLAGDPATQVTYDANSRRAIASPTIFTSPVFPRPSLGVRSRRNSWVAVELTYSGALRPTAVDVIDLDGAVIAHGTAAGNALAAGWDSTRGARGSTAVYDTGPQSRQAWQRYPW